MLIKFLSRKIRILTEPLIYYFKEKKINHGGFIVLKIYDKMFLIF